MVRMSSLVNGVQIVLSAVRNSFSSFNVVNYGAISRE